MDDEARYRAFLSYSWKDKVWGERLHRWLENYRIPDGVAAPFRRLGGTRPLHFRNRRGDVSPCNHW